MYVPWLADAARSTGYRVVEISGWQSRGHGGMRAVEGVVGHHTATSQAAPGDYPSLGIVTNGRSDLAGPLANLGLGRDGTIYVIAAGLCYHAGASRWAGFTDLNDEFLGIEAESAGTGVWTDAQRDCYPKLVGALLKYMSRGTDRYAGHKDVCVPTGRKIDPVGIDTQGLRSAAASFIAGHSTPIVEDDMPLSGTDFKYLFYDNAIQEFGNLSQLLNDVKLHARTADSNAAAANSNASAAKAAVAAVGAAVADVQAKVAALSTPEIDYDVLAAKVASLVAPAVQAGLASAVVDEEARRLQN